MKPSTKNTAALTQEYEEDISKAVLIGELWFEKYRPQSFDDIIISHAKIVAIRDWFVSFEDKTAIKKALLFTGPPGLGKTSLAHLVLKQFGYKIKEFNASDIRSQSLVNQNMYDIICISDVINSSSPIGIIMDEVDGMLTGDRGGIDELLSFIQPNKARKTRKKTKAKNKKVKTNVWGPPIICICNTGNVKLNTISQLRKNCVEIAFTKPSNEEIRKVIMKVAENEKFELEEAAIPEIIRYSQYDFRRLLCLLQHLYSRYGDYITKNNVVASYHIFCQKEQDLHVKDNIKRILNKQLDYETVMNVYQRDKSKTPMVMHQNYIKAIEVQNTTPFKRIDNAISSIESLVDSDIIEKTMYNTQGWHLQLIQGLTCCCIPSYHINKVKKLKVIEANWTEVLGTSSHTQTSKKKIQEILYLMDKKNSYSSTDIQFLAEMVIHLLITARESEAISLLKSYGLLESKIIDKLSSIVKLNDYSNHWKSKPSSEKTRIDNLIIQNQSSNNDVIEMGVVKISTPGKSATKIEKTKTDVTVKTTVKPKTPEKIPATVVSKKNPKRKLVLLKKAI